MHFLFYVIFTYFTCAPLIIADCAQITNRLYFASQLLVSSHLSCLLFIFVDSQTKQQSAYRNYKRKNCKSILNRCAEI